VRFNFRYTKGFARTFDRASSRTFPLHGIRPQAKRVAKFRREPVDIKQRQMSRIFLEGGPSQLRPPPCRKPRHGFHARLDHATADSEVPRVKRGSR
jgi:hypothetical protein